MSRASVGASLRSSGNISIVKPANGSFVDDDGTGRYGPFNIQYPSYYSNETGKYEFVGDEFTILLNGKKLTTLPQSGVDFYLTEADGVIPGERNVIIQEHMRDIYQKVHSFYEFNVGSVEQLEHITQKVSMMN